MVRRSVVLAFMLATTPALAAGYLSGDKLFETLAGKTFVWPDKTVSTYARGGGYRWEGTTKLEGTWRVRRDQICVTYSSGAKRCDKFVYSGNELQLEDAKGKRFRAEQVDR
jgi:hypothetical protein